MISLISMTEVLALMTGVAAATSLTLAPAFKSRNYILLAQLAAGLCFAAHYALLGVAVASAANLLGALQTVFAILAPKSRWMNLAGYVLIGLMILSGVLLWQGPVSAFSVAAMSLIAFGRMQSRQVLLRTLLLAGGLFWLVHDLLVEAWIAFAADIGALLVGVTALLAIFVRITVEWRPGYHTQTAPAI